MMAMLFAEPSQAEVDASVAEGIRSCCGLRTFEAAFAVYGTATQAGWGGAARRGGAGGGTSHAHSLRAL